MPRPTLAPSQNVWRGEEPRSGHETNQALQTLFFAWPGYEAMHVVDGESRQSGMFYELTHSRACSV